MRLTSAVICTASYFSFFCRFADCLEGNMHLNVHLFSLVFMFTQFVCHLLAFALFSSVSIYSIENYLLHTATTFIWSPLQMLSVIWKLTPFNAYFNVYHFFFSLLLQLWNFRQCDGLCEQQRTDWSHWKWLLRHWTAASNNVKQPPNDRGIQKPGPQWRKQSGGILIQSSSISPFQNDQAPPKAVSRSTVNFHRQTSTKKGRQWRTRDRRSW